MYELFTGRYETNISIIKPPGFELIKRTYEREVNKIANYYHDRVYSIKSNHLLCRLINTGSIPLNYDLYRYMEIANVRAPYLAKYFNFTSSISYGKVHDGIFYGEGNKELILLDDEYFNPFDVKRNWKNIQAVKVIDHPISDLGLILPNGHVNSSDKGIAIFQINIALLLMQYRFFAEEQILKNNAGMLGVQHFVHMYVLPNMLYSHIELVILNRLMNIFYVAPMGDALKKYPFAVINYGNKLDNVLIEVLEHIENKRLLYVSSMKNIPAIFNENMFDFLTMPDIAKTRQVWWLLMLSKFKIIKFLLDVGGKEGQKNNLAYINKLKIDLKRIYIEDITKGLFDVNTAYDIKEQVKYFLSI